jgi:hypothetical protein
MMGFGKRSLPQQERAMGPLLIASLVASLLGLPVAAWLDLRALSERMLKT